MTEKVKSADPNERNALPSSHGQETTQEGTQYTATMNTTPDPTDRLDDIDRYLRVSSKKVRKFWYTPDLKNTQLRDLVKNRLHHPCDPVKILINAPELRQFYPTSTFEICLDSGKVYTYTDPKVDIRVGLEPEPFIIEELKNHFRELTKPVEIVHHVERIPLIERTMPTTEVMPLRELEKIIGTYNNLCIMHGKASCELFRRSSISEEETARAYNELQPYISDILEQVEMGLSLFRMEREIRNRKGRGMLRIPDIIPKEKTINTSPQLQVFFEEVDDDLSRVIRSIRDQQKEFENREIARKEEAEKARQEQLTRNGFPFQNITSTPLRGESSGTQWPNITFHTTSQNRQAHRVNFNPNPTRHSYANTAETNSSDEYEQFSNGSIIQRTEMNNHISPSNTGDAGNDPHNDWNQGNRGAYGPETLVVQVSQMNTQHQGVQ